MSIGLVIAIVAVIALVVKRFYGEPMNARDTFGPPVILLAIGVYSVSKVTDLNGTDITWLIIGGAVGLAFGALRGTTIGIFTRDGHLWQRYTVRTVIVWAVSMFAGFVISALGTTMGMHHDARPTTLSIGISMVGEMLTLGLRALSTGVPFAPAKASSSSLLDRFAPPASEPTNPVYPRPNRPETEDHPPAPNHRYPNQSHPEINAAPYPSASTHPYQPPRLDHSPTLRDALDWLNRTRNR
ncbi:hypothetical protein [Nocardia anaemiae]|uniref:hypothetical protein n=1 Tax=Nocardia anaemiae TaxID=263910 RepID=UPI000AEDA644|nr:hypothetical protein [Nocardia anaemiae]